MTLDEANAFIHRTDWKGSRLGLERMRELMHALGDPQEKLKFIHVAGTNGKGSTSAMIAAILSAAGYTTGRYTSPHLWRLNERIAVDGAEISDDDLCAAAEEVARCADGMADLPTEFEIITAMAFVYFHRRCCDFVVLEVGLGGRLDATNIIPPPEAAVLCNIGLEHTQILGDTIAKIAGEKAGIIKPGCPVIAYPSAGEALDVFRRVCAEKGASLHLPGSDTVQLRSATLDGQVLDWPGLPALKLPLLGRHQVRNAAVALETVEVLRTRGTAIPNEAVRQGLSAVRWPGRFEVLRRDPLFIMDGAHNPQCIEALADNLEQLLPGTQVVFLMGVLADKDFTQMLRRLIPFARAFVCLTPDSNRALPAQELARQLSAMGQTAVACPDAASGLREAFRRAEGLPVVACGSLYMIGQVRRLFLEKN